jgi:Ca2+-binding RTX toxin-like protein
MFSISAVQTFQGASSFLISGIGDMEMGLYGGNMMLFAATRAGGGIVAIDIDAGMALADSQTYTSTAQLPVGATLDIVSISGYPFLVVSGSYQSSLLTYRIEPTGTIGGFLRPSGGPMGAISAQAFLTVGGQTYLYANTTNDSSIRVYQMAVNGTLTQVQDLPLGEDIQGVVFSEMQGLTVGGQTWLAALSTADDRLVLLAVGSDGRLTEVASLGAANGLGVESPTGLEVLQVHGRSFLVVTSPVTSTLSMIEVTETGGLRVADMLGDTLDTRFQGAMVAETFIVAGRGFVVTGGNDLGLTLFEVLPDGRLVAQGSFLAEPGMAFQGIAAITARVTATGVDLFVAGEGAGITRLSIALADLPGALIGTGAAETLAGGAGADLILGGGGNDRLLGAEGADILTDGAGRDELFGGAGADSFVLVADRETDIIRDFQAGTDRIDLSAWGRVYSLDALTITPVTGGAIITFLNERLEVYSANGLPLTRAQFEDAGFFDLWHITATLQMAPRVFAGSAISDQITGTKGNDLFVGSSGHDTISGMQGDDHVDMSAADGCLVVDLQAGTSTGDCAEGQTYLSVEWFSGGSFGDRLTGSAAANRLWGNDGDDVLNGRSGGDRLYGGAGADTLIGGAGADTLIGGDGIDRITFAEATMAVRVDLLANKGRTGEATGDFILDIEEVEGSAFADGLNGDHGANRLIGLAGDDKMIARGGADLVEGGIGHDTLLGGAGADTLIGGDGTDVASYTIAEGGIRLDMTTTASSAGEAAGDVLLGIENVLGSRYDDTILGNGADNFIWALMGNDSLVGREGDDRLSGGAGADTLDGGLGDDTMVGGFGADVFIYDGGRDTISDFVRNQDLIVLRSDAWGGGSRTVADILATAVENVAENHVRLFLAPDNVLTIRNISDADLLVGRLLLE